MTVTNAPDHRGETATLDAEALDGLLCRSGLEVDDLRMAQEGLARLLEALSAQTGLSEQGRAGVASRLRTRIKGLGDVAADRRRHPGIADVEIRRPIFVMGLPRSGTTILHSILAQDPDTRSPLSWELQFPSPPPERATYDADPRIEAWNQANLKPDAPFSRQSNEFRRKHLTGAQVPEECGQIMGATMRGTEFWARCQVPAYMSWWLQADHLWDYQVHRRWLQHYQWRTPATRWALKWPHHMFHLDDLMAVYPDACLVQLHRDPKEVISSVSSLLTTIRKGSFGGVDPEAVAQEMLELYATGVDRMVDFRQRNPQTPVVDVRYRDLLLQPMRTVEALYTDFAIDMTREARQAIQAFIDGAPQNAHGEHKHELADFGLTSEQVERRMAAYIGFSGEHLR